MDGLIHFLDLHTFQPSDLLIVAVLIVLEGLLSCDNAVVLAMLVKDLPPEQRGKALRYGIIGAYVFRIIAILLATWIVSVWWLKVLGGAYLCWLTASHFLKKKPAEADMEQESKTVKRIFGLSIFWSTVIWVELTDIVFSVDSIAAAVALSSKLWILILGGLLGILAMRFAAQGFVKLLDLFPKLEACAFAAVGVIGVKLLLELPVDLWTDYRPVAPTYTNAREYARNAEDGYLAVFRLGHAVTVNRSAPQEPSEQILAAGARATVLAKEPQLQGEALEAKVADTLKRELRESRAWWNLHARPVVHIEGWASSIVIVCIFAFGFLKRKKATA